MNPMADEELVALVSGGNRGIGLAVCEGLAGRGVRVYMGCRDPAEGMAAIERRQLMGVTPIQLDVCSESSCPSASATSPARKA
jgi:NAD(P)-dependent dehydrogenase (short-subunit alcohol dehydrogenase family)